MVDAAISTTVRVVLGTVTSLAADRIGMVLGVKKELERLSKTATMIQGFLADADGKMHSPRVREWLKQLEDEVFKADNVLDELNYGNLRREVKYRNQPIKKKVCFFSSFFNAIGFSSSLASKIRDINTNLESINQQAHDLGLNIQSNNEADAAGATTSRQTDCTPAPNVVGRDDDVSKIVEMLLTPSDRVVPVIPITGTGGLGKTTLAKSVYNNPKINENFGRKIWVCVARKIDTVELRYLSVWGCPNLESFALNLQETPSLEEFYLLDCPKLILHSFKGFASATCLREMSIGPFFSNGSSIDDFDWFGLISASSLREFNLRGLPHVDSLPQQIRYLTTLTSLRLDGFGAIEVLPDWIGDLVSLEVLRLLSCEKLQSLPSEAAMRRLIKFTSVHVYNCPLLRQRYTPQRGIYLEEEISSDLVTLPKSNDGAQISALSCFPSLLKKKSSGES